MQLYPPKETSHILEISSTEFMSLVMTPQKGSWGSGGLWKGG